MKYLSVCSGIEAATQAWSPLSWEAVAYSEIEPFPCAVLAHHYPRTSNWGDMTRYKEWPDATFDVLCGGTPCQSFSLAGLRKGLDDPRGDLMLTYLAIAERYRPLSSDQGRDFGALLGGLAELGYGFAYRILDAQYSGLAQRRRRVFVVGRLGDWRCAAAVLFERASLSGHPAPSRQTRKIATPAVAPCLKARGSGFGRTGEVPGVDPIVVVPTTANTLTAPSRQTREIATPDVAPCLKASGCGVSRAGDSRGQDPVVVVPEVSNTLTARMHKGINTTVDEGQTPIVSMTMLTSHTSAHSQGPSEEVAYTLDQTNGQAVAARQHVGAKMRVRRLTPRECERLMGFPDDYTEIPWRGKAADRCPDGPRYKALGNSWAVPCARWIGERIERVEELTHKEVA